MADIGVSVVYVNYNVEHLLYQSYQSLIAHHPNVPLDVIIVDNNSEPRSIVFLEEKIPEAQFILNPVNKGFGYACNQGIKSAKYPYILLLNPDTLFLENTLEIALDYYTNQEGIGFLGVQMTNERDEFLEESKRGIPTLTNTFFKLSGLQYVVQFIPKIKHYNLNKIHKNEIEKVPILTGAFLLGAKSVYERLGGFDESFFMYGEDIDLCYRAVLKGYKNVYLGSSRIIHFKGASSFSNRESYYKTFYDAMSIYAKKHMGFSGKGAFSTLVNVSIIFRKTIARIKEKFIQPLSILWDFVFIYALFSILKFVWGFIKYGDWSFYNSTLSDDLVLLVSSIIWIMLFSFYHKYAKPLTTDRIIGIVVFGSLLNLIFYSLIPETARFSRMVMILQPLVILTYLSAFRRRTYHPRNDAIVQNNNSHVFWKISPQDKISEHHVGNLSHLDSLQKSGYITRVAIQLSELSPTQITNIIKRYRTTNLDIHLITPSHNTSFFSGHNRISNPLQFKSGQRNKRIFDIFSSLLLLPFVPLISKVSLGDCFQVLVGKKTWIGIYPQSEQFILKQGVFTYQQEFRNQETKEQFALKYGLLFSITREFRILLNQIQ